MLADKIVRYVLLSLEGEPDVYARLLMGVTDTEADRRPDPARFTLREALAHVAEWEDVFLQRMTATRDTDTPLLQGYDEGQWAIDHNYAHADVPMQLALFRQRRVRNVAFLRALAPDQWARTGRHTEVGPITLEEQMLLMLAHDGYHARQFAEWRV